MITVHAIAKLAESARGARDRILVQQASGKRIVAQAHCGAISLQNLYVLGRGGACDGQPNGVRTGVD
jgi:hypothetical protein